MLAKLNQETAKKLLWELADRDQQLAEEIRSKMFSFDDIAKLANQDIQELLKRLDHSQLKLALRKTTPFVKEAILKNLSERAVTLLNEDMAALGQVRVS